MDWHANEDDDDEADDEAATMSALVLFDLFVRYDGWLKAAARRGTLTA